MTFVAGLLVLALLGPAQPRTYYWRDASGQTHITNTPPPADAEILDSPPPPAVEPMKGGRPNLVRQNPNREGRPQVALNPAQQQAWNAVQEHLAKARASGDRRTIEAVADSLIDNCLWGNGLWAMPLLPVLSVLLMGLMGWWLALGLRTSSQVPLIVGFLALGIAFGQLLLTVFLYQPQAGRLRQNLELLERHKGSEKPMRPEHRTLLQEHYQALERAAEPLQAPWHFPSEVKALRETAKRVMVDP